jgi:glycosyltransferase involved in cell wall biosynthesis
MEFTVLIPVLNGEKLILDTLNSIYDAALKLNEKGFVNIVVIDGGSKDNTIEFVKDWYLGSNKNFFIKLKIFSKPDKGLYDGLSNHIANFSTGILSYLNCGDLYEETAFLNLSNIFNDPNVLWVTGQNQYVDRFKVKQKFSYFIYRNKLIQRGVYGRFPFCPVVQQESTFWRAFLTNDLDLKTFRKFILAGDFFLWKHLSSRCKLFTFKFSVASYVYHENQLSLDVLGYRKEMNEIRDYGFTLHYLLLLLDIFHNNNILY